MDERLEKAKALVKEWQQTRAFDPWLLAMALLNLVAWAEKEEELSPPATPPITAKATTVSPWDAQPLEPIVPRTRPSLQWGQPVIESGLAELGSGCAHLWTQLVETGEYGSTLKLDKFWCHHCGALRESDKTRVPAAQPTT